MKTAKRTRVSGFFRWYDLWVGVYLDRKNRVVYICPLPTIGLKIWQEEVTLCPVCNKALTKVAVHDGEGWGLYLECYTDDCFNYCQVVDDIVWPFGNRWMTAKDFEEAGYDVA